LSNFISKDSNEKDTSTNGKTNSNNIENSNDSSNHSDPSKPQTTVQPPGSGPGLAGISPFGFPGGPPPPFSGFQPGSAPPSGPPGFPPFMPPPGKYSFRLNKNFNFYIFILFY
jgi:hypothetical protein